LDLFALAMSAASGENIMITIKQKNEIIVNMFGEDNVIKLSDDVWDYDNTSELIIKEIFKKCFM
ncbi:MAG: hypothetical protein MJ237_09285, partial [bacterium]|nr:hypothetical protein [bacterium]